MESNRPRGREKNITGQGKPIEKRGDALNTGGPVGKQDGYQSRSDAQSGGSFGGRASGTTGSKGMSRGMLVVIAIMVLLVIGGSFFTTKLNDLLNSATIGGNQSNSDGSIVQSGVLGSLMGGSFTNGGTVSTGWAQASNTGRLNTGVAEGAREKRTTILGNNQDKITLMVYMCGTDLESKHGMGTADINEMLNATIGNNITLLVYTGGCNQWKNNVISSSVNQIYKIENGKLRCLVSDDGHEAMTKPATLTRFIKYCTENYPANRYQLIFWDHGGGSVSGYGYDEKYSSTGSMSLKGIDEALKNAETTFDFIGFDCCLMGTLENALMLEPYADYLIASEETEPGVGWYYTKWLTELSQNTSMPTIEIGKNIIDDFVDVCAARCAGQKATLSLIDLAELGSTVGDSFKAFAVGTSELITNNYQAVSDARNNTREFATSSRIDQIDLVHLAHNLNTDESKALASIILSAVKYNRTSSDMTNCYGLSIFFPYRRSSKVDSAVATYEAIGLDSAYSRCIQQFASMGVAGQAAGQTASAGGVSSPLSALLGGGSGSGTLPSAGGIGDLLGTLLGGGDMLSGLTGGSFDFFGKSLGDTTAAAEYISSHQFDPNALVWTKSGDKDVMKLSEAQWNLVHDLQLNVFYDDGEGYIDLGLDNVFEFTSDGALIGEYDGTWLAIDGQNIAYYYVDSVYNGSNYTITGRVPVLLNGERANLILVFNNQTRYGYIAGARMDYVNGETDTIAKGITELENGDVIEFICDYYSYDGVYQNSYRLGDALVYNGNHVISNVYIDASRVVAAYMFTDIYCQEYWTPAIPSISSK